MQSELIEIEEFDKIFFKYSERFIEDFKKCVILYIDGLTVEPSTDALKYYEQLTTELDSKDPDDHILDTNVELAIGEPKYYIDHAYMGNDSNLLIVFYVQIMPDDFVMQLHRF